MGKLATFSHPADTPVSAALRFPVELAAWVGGPWAAAQQVLWLAVPVAVVLVGLPAVFSTPGDKRQVIVATPGPLRVLIELGLYAAAVAAAWAAWPSWVAVLVTAMVAGAVLAGVKRTRWLLRGATG